MAAEPFLIPKLARNFQAAITLPGSKSIALRQLAMAAVAPGCSKIYGIPACDDTDAMLECLDRLGARVTSREDHVEIHGPMDYDSDVTLNARMSGASTRLLIGLAALRSGSTTIDGHSSLRARTNAPLLQVLSTHGCKVVANDGKLPATITGPLSAPNHLEIDGSLSSQYVTALLLCAPLFAQQNTLTVKISGELVSRPYIDITVNEMAKRGAQAHWQDKQTLVVKQGGYTTGTVTVEGDATAATYFAALATLHGGNVTLNNLGNTTKQGDYGFLEVMQTLGADVQRHSTTTQIKGPAQMKPLAVTDMNDMPDAALTLIALAPLIPGETCITGLSSLHHKECDRLECPAAEFKGMGIHAQTTVDSIVINAVEPTSILPHVLSTYHDHRMAMAFSLLGSVCGNLTVDDKSVVNKTYPNYWRDYSALI